MIAVDVSTFHKREHAKSEGHSNELSVVVGTVVSEVAIHRFNVSPLHGDETVRTLLCLLHSDAQNHLDCLLTAYAQMLHLEYRLPCNGACHEVFHREVFEESWLQRQQETVVVNITAECFGVAVKETVLVYREIQLYHGWLEEVVVGKPRILMCGCRKYSLVDVVLSVHLWRNNCGIVPRISDVNERITCQSAEIVLQHKRLAWVCDGVWL